MMTSGDRMVLDVDGDVRRSDCTGEFGIIFV